MNLVKVGKEYSIFITVISSFQLFVFRHSSVVFYQSSVLWRKSAVVFKKLLPCNKAVYIIFLILLSNFLCTLWKFGKSSKFLIIGQIFGSIRMQISPSALWCLMWEYLSQGPKLWFWDNIFVPKPPVVVLGKTNQTTTTDDWRKKRLYHLIHFSKRLYCLIHFSKSFKV